MLIGNTNFNNLWSGFLIEELVRSGIEYFCISPGSRSTPLTVAAARNPRAQTIVCHDERGAAFHALGYARSQCRAAVLICTSGTAAAHYYPAVIEAALDRLPMIILSADRPPELQQTGANQTIQQGHLFGAYSKWYFEIPCPSTEISARLVLTTIDQAFYRAHEVPAGPVHLNLLFREPLEPVPEGIQDSYLDDLTSWLKVKEPFTRYEPSTKLPETRSIVKVGKLLKATQRGIVSIGRLAGAAERAAVLDLIRALGWPVFPDILSGFRLGSQESVIIHYFDQLLLAKSFQNECAPETVLHIGGELTSKRFSQFLSDVQPRHHILIKDHPFRHDSLHSVSLRLDADILKSCSALIQHIEGNTKSAAWADKISSQSRLIHEVISNYILTKHTVSEISLAFLISQNIPKNHGLWLASSMPIRDMDMYGSYLSHGVPVGANRGASGIEGTIAAALGYAAGLRSPVTLVIGDIAFLHDINSLALLEKCSYPITLVVINNNGGGIFSFLPIAKIQDVFEDYFATPHDLVFKCVAEMFSIAYCAPETNAEFVDAYRRAVNAGNPAIIEVMTDRAKNYQLHQALQQMIVARLENP